MAGKSVRITDEVCGRTAHVVTWQLAPEWQLVENLTWRHANGTVVTLSIEGDAVQSCEVVQNEVSPRFGQVVQAPAVRVTFTGRLVSTFSR